MARLSRTLMLAVALCAGAAVLAACGGAAETPSGAPTLVGTTIPTAVLPTPTPPICTPPANLSLPAAFPDELRSIVPAGFVVWRVQTSQNLIVEGRSTPPSDSAESSPLYGVVARAIREQVAALGWSPRINVDVGNTDVTATAPDGRVLHFFTWPHDDCPGQVSIVFDLQWIKG